MIRHHKVYYWIASTLVTAVYLLGLSAALTWLFNLVAPVFNVGPVSIPQGILLTLIIYGLWEIAGKFADAP